VKPLRVHRARQIVEVAQPFVTELVEVEQDSVPSHARRLLVSV
jgi:hypothetical protein